MMDDRKNAEDWMVDFALRRAVDKLAPARKRKVALLVEAFETVMPTSKWELRRSAAGFAHSRPIQACRRCQFKVDISGEQVLYKLSLSGQESRRKNTFLGANKILRSRSNCLFRSRNNWLAAHKSQPSSMCKDFSLMA